MTDQRRLTLTISVEPAVTTRALAVALAVGLPALSMTDIGDGRFGFEAYRDGTHVSGTIAQATGNGTAVEVTNALDPDAFSGNPEVMDGLDVDFERRFHAAVADAATLARELDQRGTLFVGWSQTASIDGGAAAVERELHRAVGFQGTAADGTLVSISEFNGIHLQTRGRVTPVVAGAATVALRFEASVPLSSPDALEIHAYAKRFKQAMADRFERITDSVRIGVEQDFSDPQATQPAPPARVTEAPPDRPAARPAAPDRLISRAQWLGDRGL